MKPNPLTMIDFYKADHRRQYPEGTTLVYSNFTPRSDKLSNIPTHLFDGKVVFFGLQYFVKLFLIDTWNAEFFIKPKAEVVARYNGVNAYL
jgi:nicotinamide phosphoribosyltransferase